MRCTGSSAELSSAVVFANIIRALPSNFSEKILCSDFNEIEVFYRILKNFQVSGETVESVNSVKKFNKSEWFCTYCKRKGHTIKFCFDLQKKNKRKKFFNIFNFIMC